MSSVAPPLGALPQPYLNQTIPAAQTQPATAHLVAQFEKAVYASDAAALKNLAQKTPDLLAKPFSNGDLPLAAAVKSKHSSSVKVLLELGASPTQRDDQLLSAIDYALLMQDQQQIAEILHHFISEDLSSIQTMLQNPYALNQARDGLAEIQKIQTELTKINATYYPILFKAVMQKDKALVASILAQPNINVAECTSTGQSILHIAIATGDAEILDQCLAHSSAKGLVNLPNNKGRTPLHFAAALGRLDMMRSLSAKGANLRQTDNNQITPLALLAVSAEQKDPLKISKLELFIFLSTTALWSTQFIPLQGMRWQTYVKIMDAITLLNGLTSAINFLSTFNSKREFAAYLLAAASIFNAILASSSLHLWSGIGAMNIALGARKVFNGLRSCWRNAALGKGRALLKAVVAYGPAAKMAVNNTSLLLTGNLDALLSTRQIDQINFLARRGLCTQTSYRSEDTKQCMDKLWKTVQLCDIDNSSLECTNAGAQFESFVKEMQAFKLREDLCERSSSIQTHVEQCIDKSLKIFQSCGTDPSSEECQNTGDQFLEFLNRMRFYNQKKDVFAGMDCFSSTQPQKCYEALENYQNQCAVDLNSQECREAESILKKILKLDLQSAAGDVCEQARSLIGCKLTDTVNKCKQIFSKKVKQVHPDINPESAQPTDTSELVKAMRTIKECAKEKDA
jgi:ankyrin repeat protein